MKLEHKELPEWLQVEVAEIEARRARTRRFGTAFAIAYFAALIVIGTKLVALI